MLNFLAQVTSWNNGKERTYTGNKNDERSFIRCITEYDDSDKYSCDGHSTKDMGTCRMVSKRCKPTNSVPVVEIEGANHTKVCMC